MVVLLVKNRGQILEIVDLIIDFESDHKNEYTKSSIEILTSELKSRILNLKDNVTKNISSSIELIRIGAITMHLYNKLKKVQGQSEFNPISFANFLWSKHKKYGAAPLTEVGTIGIAMRLIAKINRFINMQTLANTLTGDDEDTLMDIIGYCVLGYTLMQVTHG